MAISARVTSAWTKKTDVEAGRRDDIYGQTYFLPESEGPAVRFVRRGSKNSHGENILYQAINRDVSDFVSLKLSVDFRIIYQTLSGGGYLGSEYPLLVQVTYRDEAGNQHTWARGFSTRTIPATRQPTASRCG